MHDTTTRRDLLKSAAALAAVAALPAAHARAKDDPDELLKPTPPPTTMPALPDKWRGLKVGVATYSLRKLPLDEAIKAIARVDAHFCSIKDFHLSLKAPAEERKAVAAKFRAAGVEPISCGTITMADDAAVRAALEYARDIGATTIVCNPDPAVLPACDKLVKEFDIRLAIHNHGPEDKRWPSPLDVMKKVEVLDARIGVCVDVGHTARAGVDPAAVIRRIGPRVYDIHMKDVSKVNAPNPRVEIEVGRGVLDIGSMFKALLEIKFTGHVGFEYERFAEDPVPGLAESLGYAKGIVAQLG